MLNTLHVKVLASSFWHNIYYKHTKKHKNDMKRTSEKSYAIRKKILGK